MGYKPEEIPLSKQMAEDVEASIVRWWMIVNCTHCHARNISKAKGASDMFVMGIYCDLKHSIMSCAICADHTPKEIAGDNLEPQPKEG